MVLQQLEGKTKKQNKKKGKKEMSRIFENRIVRVLCIVLACAAVLGAVSGLASLGKEKPSTGVVYPEEWIEEVEKYGQRSSDYARLYDQKGLVACYVAYGADSVKEKATDTGEKAYSWKNYATNGKDALLYGSGYWRRMDGGIGYTMTADQWAADKNNVGCDIPFYLDYANESLFDVECVMTFTGVTDSSGNLYNAPTVTYPNGMSNMRKSAFRFGLLHTLTFVASSSSNANQTFGNRWFMSNYSPYEYYQLETIRNNESTDLPEDQRVKIYGTALNGSALDAFPSQNRGKIALLNVSRTTTNYNGDVVFTSQLCYGRFKSGEGVVTGTIGQSAVLNAQAHTSQDTAGKFSLFNGMPGTLYSVRYYDRNIDMDTRNRNFFVDLCGFYDVNVASFFSLSATVRSELLSECGALAYERGLELDSTKMATNKSAVYAIITECWPG